MTNTPHSTRNRPSVPRQKDAKIEHDLINKHKTDHRLC
jgi:hypothetical protein